MAAWAFLLGATAAPAQPPPDTLLWELVGDTLSSYDILSAGGIEVIGDIVLVAGDGPRNVGGGREPGVFTVGPRDTAWTRISDAFHTPYGGLWATSADTLMGRRSEELVRSPDGGRTWERAYNETQSETVRSPVSGDLVMGEGDCCGIVRSADGGVTWTTVRTAPLIGFVWMPFVLHATPPSEALPAGRLVGVGRGGIAYSDDDGYTWRASDGLAENFRFYGRGLTRLPDGRLLALMNDFSFYGGNARVYESTDAGATWAFVGQLPPFAQDSDIGGFLLAAPDGAVYAVNKWQDSSPIYRSLDAGRTWKDMGPVVTAWLYNPEELALGPDGRLWLASSHSHPSTGNHGGVFRTVEPVFPVADEPRPPATAARLRLEAYPNPSAEAVEVAFVVEVPGPTRLDVIDLRGRTVAVLSDGPRPAGEHRVRWATSAVPAGAYVLRLQAGGEAASETVTVVR